MGYMVANAILSIHVYGKNNSKDSYVWYNVAVIQ